MARRHLVTGATGFIGAALVLELMARTEDEVYCLVRGERGVSPADRLRRTLHEAAQAYDMARLEPEIARRCHPLTGDVSAPMGGLATAGLAVDEVWHSAASLRYSRSAAAEIERTNVRGTAHVLELARALKASVFNYVSTAYVAGRRTGLVMEEPAARDTVPNNLYEESKIKAEGLVLAEEGVRVRVLRPSIVIGHSQTRATFSSFGLYGSLIHFVQFRDRVRARLGDYLSHYRAQLFGRPETPMNFIPVDYVARNAVTISLSGSPGRIFHLANADPPTLRELSSTGFSYLGMREPEIIEDKARFSSLDRALDSGLEFYASYTRFPKVFDQTQTESACGAEACRFRMQGEGLTSFLDWFLTHRYRSSRGAAASPARLPAHS